MRIFSRSVLVIARRDFTAILFSRAFLFFLVGPLFPVLVGGLAGGIGASVSETASQPVLGVAMSPPATERVLAASRSLGPRLSQLPDTVATGAERAGAEKRDAAAIIASREANYGAVLSGTLDYPVLTGSPDFVARWRGPAAVLVAQARSGTEPDFRELATKRLASSQADQTGKRIRTAQAAQTALFLLTIMLAGMVLSNLVEEKANKIIEVLAAAVPMDAVFMGKLLAMLGVSLVGIVVWGVAGALAFGAIASGGSLPFFAAPAIGWPLFLALGVVYFACAYLLLGSLFLTIGALASTVREVQTLSMPVTMMQLLVFFFASFTLAHIGEPVEIAAIAFPFSSPFAMIARGAVEPAILPHLLAIAWQILWVFVIVRIGARLFRRSVLKSGPSATKRSIWCRTGRAFSFMRPSARKG